MNDLRQMSGSILKNSCRGNSRQFLTNIVFVLSEIAG